ncbi:MAG: hypothetical protein A4E57_02302 [Syntrophorhabdaceae bacterium PtaU1.Bin034]|nr:MAG: hypothetical protein A4E57_02302 [Syntrophorhabdaceae bacterium PtaU1.Bin034]
MEHMAIREGMVVLDSAGDMIGTVKETRDTSFLVDRRREPDIDVSYSAVASVGDRVQLNVDIPELLEQVGDFPKH